MNRLQDWILKKELATQLAISEKAKQPRRITYKDKIITVKLNPADIYVQISRQSENGQIVDLSSMTIFRRKIYFTAGLLANRVLKSIEKYL
jgi:hypothetical protein